MTENVVKGYLDVKISSKSRRGFTPWRAWQKQWCEIRRLDDIEVGVELKLKSSEDGGLLSCIQVPRSATLCRTESRSKQFAFGVFNLRKTKKAVLFLAGTSESDSQEWMISIRRMLCIANYIPIGDSNFRISLVDTAHSRRAGLLGLYGVLNTNNQEIIISDPCTGIMKIGWKWYHFHQFHLQATSEQKDDKKIVVMHSSREFPSGPGQLLLYCRDGIRLLHYLITRGQSARLSSGLLCSKRFSRSEGDLCGSRSSIPDSPLCFRSQAGSDDSGIPSTNQMEDNNELGAKFKTESNLVNLGINEVTKTPGGSETEDSYTDLTISLEDNPMVIRRNESGISLSSGIYEEIPDNHPSSNQDNMKFQTHIYENPLDLILANQALGKFFKAPPLPPRPFTSFTLQRKKESLSPPTMLYATPSRCNTLPAKDLSKISQIFNFVPGQKSENEYVVMSPNRTIEKTKKILSENFYVPMSSPVIQLKGKIMDGVYINMNANVKKAT
ncbi:hypothetical protein ABEB36_003209 [Hypothenemus hampei]|uniref:PH domain-containing protein n=1 Tax=Hypothenemus hampei TaxID=57062 RepID=A0ABD1F8F9_HYPHA